MGSLQPRAGSIYELRSDLGYHGNPAPTKGEECETKGTVYGIACSTRHSDSSAQSPTARSGRNISEVLCLVEQAHLLLLFVPGTLSLGTQVGQAP